MVLEIKCWMLTTLNKTEMYFWCWMHETPGKKICSGTNFFTIQHDLFFFYEMLDEIGAFKRIQHFFRHRKFQHCMLDEMFDLLNSAYNLGQKCTNTNFMQYFIRHDFKMLNEMWDWFACALIKTLNFLKFNYEDVLRRIFESYEIYVTL